MRSLWSIAALKNETAGLHFEMWVDTPLPHSFFDVRIPDGMLSTPEHM